MTSLLFLKRKTMGVKPSSSVIFNNLKTIYGWGQLICVRSISPTPPMFYLLVDFIVYKGKGELSLDCKILGFVQHPHPLLLNNLLIRCINFSPTNGRFLLKWTMELVYERRNKKLWLCNWVFLIECLKNSMINLVFKYHIQQFF